MNLSQYLAKYSQVFEITLVGPLTKKIGPLVEPTVFVDGGVDFRVSSEFGFAVGDGDSGQIDLLDEVLPTEKCFSDLAYVLDRLPENINKVNLVGFTGGRIDHEMINYGEIHRFLQNKTNSQVEIAPTPRAFSPGLWTVQIRSLFSLIVLESASITISGACKYTIDKPTLLGPMSSAGLSNIGNGKVSIGSSSPFFIFHQP